MLSEVLTDSEQTCQVCPVCKDEQGREVWHSLREIVYGNVTLHGRESYEVCMCSTQWGHLEDLAAYLNKFSGLKISAELIGGCRED